MIVSRCAAALILLLVCIGFAELHGAGAAQQQKNRPELAHRPAPNPDAPEGRIRLDVLASDGSGHIVAGLQQENFTLFDNKKPRPILSFRAIDGTTGDGTRDEPPVEVILLIDATNNSLSNIAYERSRVETFLRQNGGHLTQPLTLMIFSEQGVQVQPQPSMNGDMIAASLDKSEATMRVVPRGPGYDAIERMELSLKTLRSIAGIETRKPGRKMLIWIGPGWPMLQSSRYQMSDATARSLFNTIVETTRELREARITMYSLNPLSPESRMAVSTDYYKIFLKGVPSAERAQSGDLAVPVFSVHTGGSGGRRAHG